MARVEREHANVVLIKSLTYMNATGPELVRLSHQLGFEAADCVVVQEDIDLPLGAVRVVRMRSGDGGHRGVRSIFEAVRSDAFRRVKVGVRPRARKPEDGGAGDGAEYLLKPFTASALPLIERASAEAAAQTMELLGLTGRLVRPARDQGIA